MNAAGQGGFSLLEILVAAVIMAVGLAGLAALLLTSITATSRAENLTSASVLADSLAAQFALSPGQQSAFTADPATAARLECMAPASCSAAQFASQALAQWRAGIADALPGGTGVVCRDGSPDDGVPDSHACDGTGSLVVKIFWHERLQVTDRWARHVITVAT